MFFALSCCCCCCFVAHLPEPLVLSFHIFSQFTDDSRKLFIFLALFVQTEMLKVLRVKFKANFKRRIQFN